MKKEIERLLEKNRINKRLKWKKKECEVIKGNNWKIMKLFEI